MAAELTLSQLNGRFKLLDRPMALPAKCAVCGAVDRPVIDFGLDVEWYGVVYFCTECFTAAAQILGLVDGSLLIRAELVQRHHEDQLLAAKDVSDEYLSRFADLSREFTDRLLSIRSVSTESESEVSADDAGSAVEHSAQADGLDESASTEGSSVIVNEGPVSLPSSSGDGNGFKF